MVVRAVGGDTAYCQWYAGLDPASAPPSFWSRSTTSTASAALPVQDARRPRTTLRCKPRDCKQAASHRRRVPGPRRNPFPGVGAGGAARRAGVRGRKGRGLSRCRPRTRGPCTDARRGGRRRNPLSLPPRRRRCAGRPGFALAARGSVRAVRVVALDRVPLERFRSGGRRRQGNEAKSFTSCASAPFTPAGTWRAAMATLAPPSIDLGINAGRAHARGPRFPGPFGWGYDGVSLFNPHAPLQHGRTICAHFVDRSHAIGLGRDPRRRLQPLFWRGRELPAALQRCTTSPPDRARANGAGPSTSTTPARVGARGLRRQRGVLDRASSTSAA